MPFEYLSPSPAVSREAGRLLGQEVSSGDAIGLSGNLGAGKTFLVQGLCEGLNVPEDVRVTSPTFALVNEYRGGRESVVHADLYRIESEAELEHIGLDDLLSPDVVSLVEWCERFPVLPVDHLHIEIEILGEEERCLRVEGKGAGAEALEMRWKAALNL